MSGTECADNIFWHVMLFTIGWWRLMDWAWCSMERGWCKWLEGGSIEVANESKGNDDNNDYKNRVGNRTYGVVNMDDSSGATAENTGQLGRWTELQALAPADASSNGTRVWWSLYDWKCCWPNDVDAMLDYKWVGFLMDEAGRATHSEDCGWHF